MADGSAPYPVIRDRDPAPPNMLRQAPRTLDYSEISWLDIVSIMRAAERGETERWADLTRRMLASDGHLSAVYETRKAVLAQASFVAEPTSDDEIDVRGAKDVQEMLDGLPISRAKRDAADGIGVGYAGLEIRWEARGPWLWPCGLEWNHPRRFRFSRSFTPYIYDDGRAAAYQNALSEWEREACRANGIVGMPLDKYRWLVHTPRAFPDYPNMGGVLRPAVRYWWIKAAALRYQLSGAEIAGNGRTWGKHDPNADEATKSKFRENLENWGGDGVLVTSPAAEVEMLAPLAQGVSSVWSTLIETCDKGESKAILGSTLAADTGQLGSRSLGETQKSITIDPRAEADEEDLRHTFERDLVQSFLEVNRWAYGGRIPGVRLRSQWVEEDTATVDELLVKVGGATIDELRTARGLEAWGAERGGDAVAQMPDAAAAMLPALPEPGAEATLPVSADGSSVEAVADTALNGAQVQSLVEILAQVQAGLIAGEAAVLTIMSAFPSIPEPRARAMVAAQTSLPPPAGEEPDIAATDTGPVVEAGTAWRDTVDDHRLQVSGVHNDEVFFTDLDYTDPKTGKAMPGRQWKWKLPTFIERCVPESAPGGAPAASPLSAGGGDGVDPPFTIPDEAHGDVWALADEPTQRQALTVIGHPGLLTAQAMLDGAPLFEAVRESLIAAVGKTSTPAALERALATWQKRKAAPLTAQLERVALHGMMGGALFVAQYEAPEAFPRTIANAADGGAGWSGDGVPPFLALPFDEAVADFERRRVVSPDEFASMEASARASSFTATRLAHETLVRRARDMLARTLRDGGTFDDFRRALREDEAALGVTPAAPAYLENVYRSNVQSAYGAGRLQLITSPAVAAARPYVERRTARDNRVRPEHAALEGVVFEVTDPGLASYAPPMLAGEFQFMCRCVIVSRSAATVDLSRVVSTETLA